jgi:polysaccharide biosynthesis transport protein
MELAYFLKLVKRNWIYIAIVSLVASAITFGLLTLKNREYHSRAQLSAGITDNNQVAFSKDELSWNDANNRFTNFLEFLNSKEVFTMLSYRIMLQELESNGAYKPDDFEKLTKKYSAQDLEIARQLLKKKYAEQAMLDLTQENDRLLLEMMKDMYYDSKILSKTLQIARITGSDYFKVEVKSKNPRLSSSLVNFYCEEAIRANTTNEARKAEKSVAFFMELRDKKKLDFEKKLDSLGKAKSGSQVIDYATQSEAQINRISVLEQAKSEEQKKITGLRRAIENLNQKLGQQDIKSVQSNLNNNTILHLKTRIEHFNNLYINSGFKDTEAADSVTHLRHQLERSVSQLAHSTQGNASAAYQDLAAKKIDYEVELSMAEASLNSIQSNIMSSKGSLTHFAGNESTLTPLEMAVNLAKDEYMSVVDRYNEARNEALKNGAIVRQTEIGQPADEPEPAKRVLFSSLAAVATTVLGLSVLFMVAYFDTTIKNPENFVKNTKLPILGFVYNLPKKSASIQDLFFSEKDLDQNSKFKEQLRNLRFELEKQPAKVLLLTSTDKDEGKSFVIMSLAYSLILNYKKVLLIDTNFKHNTLSTIYHSQVNFEDYFAQSERKLLSQANHTYAIEGSKKEEAHMEDIIHTTNINGLDIISCKGNNLSPSEIFHGKRFEELLDRLRDRYDYIFMEGPSLNLYSDTKELSVYCDKVIGVFAADKSIHQIDKVSIKYLRSLGDKYLGSVLNKVDEDDLLI